MRISQQLKADLSNLSVPTTTPLRGKSTMSRKEIRVLKAAAWACVALLGLTQRQVSRTFRGISQDLEETTSFPTQRKLTNSDPFESPFESPSSINNSSKPRARFLMGIFSVQEDYFKRKMIRRALRLYNDTRICFMGSSKASMPPPPREGCELIYTFVIGAKLRGATQIMGGGPASLITNPLRGRGPRPTKKQMMKKREPKDITFLNIRENMEDGKSPTWFNYASLVMKTHDIDYAIKIDSDTGLRVDRFFEFANANLPRGGSHIYSGKLLWDTWTNASVPYMAGEFYILSRDLAEVASSTSIYRSNGIINIEDRDTGYIVWKLKPHLIGAREAGKNWLWRHNLKQIQTYKKFFRTEYRRLQSKRRRSRAGGGGGGAGGRGVGSDADLDQPNGMWQSALDFFHGGRDDDSGGN